MTRPAPERLRRLLAVVVVAVTLSTVSDAHAQPAPDGDGVGIALVDGPADRLDDPRARTAIVDHVAPGARLERRVRVTNSTDEALTVELYPGAADIRDGAFVGRDGRGGNDLSDWIAVDPSTVDVPAGGEVLTTVRIAVPVDASGGERYGVVWAQPPPGRQGGITVVNRTGIRVYLSVGGAAEPPTDVALDALAAGRDVGGAYLHVAATNTGRRAVDLTAEFVLEDEAAVLRAGPFETAGSTTLAPGDRTVLRADLSATITSGPWMATAVVRSGSMERTIEATIRIPAPGEVVGAPTPTTATIDGPNPTDGGEAPGALIAAAIALIVAVGGAGAGLSRRRWSMLRP